MAQKAKDFRAGKINSSKEIPYIQRLP